MKFFLAAVVLSVFALTSFEASAKVPKKSTKRSKTAAVAEAHSAPGKKEPGLSLSLMQYVAKTIYETMPDSAVFSSADFNSDRYVRTSTIKKHGDLSCIATTFKHKPEKPGDLVVSHRETDQYQCVFPKAMFQISSLTIIGDGALFLAQGILKNWPRSLETSDMEFEMPGFGSTLIRRTEFGFKPFDSFQVFLNADKTRSGEMLISCAKYPASLVYGEIEFIKGNSEAVVGPGPKCTIRFN
jgi:hypothetical protein